MIAQLVERWTVEGLQCHYINPSVTGSIPVREISISFLMLCQY